MRGRSVLVCIAVLLANSAAALGQQIADPDYKPTVADPAYRGDGPLVRIDQAHHNFHTASGRYKPFADLLRADGCLVDEGTGAITGPALAGVRVLVIANALGAPAMMDPHAGSPAFTDAECDAIADWVRAGGSLLLIADHAPFGAAASTLGARFGVRMSDGYATDAQHAAPGAPSPTFLLFDRENGLLADHPITRGRNEAERVSSVVTFTGQALAGPEAGVALLKLAPSATIVHRGAEPAAAPEPPAWTAQAIALSFGAGRVVVMGEAAMFSAQVVHRPGADPLTQPGTKVGMNAPGNDDQRFALNVIHWLTGLLPER